MKRYARLGVAAASLAAALGFATPAQAHWCFYEYEDYPITGCLHCVHVMDHTRLDALLEPAGVDCTPLD